MTDNLNSTEISHWSNLHKKSLTNQSCEALERYVPGKDVINIKSHINSLFDKG